MYKLGYYPTQPQTLAAIQTFLSAEPGTPIRLPDPVAGAGDALFHISRYLVDSAPEICPDLRLVELDDTRSEQIRTNHADLGGDAALGSLESIRGDWFAVAMSEQAAGLAFLNPPYDFDLDDPDNRKLRLEVKFLRNVTPKLQVSGSLVYIVPQRLLGHQKIARWLALHFTHLQAWKMVAEEHADFGQAVLLGVRPKKADSLDKAKLDWLLAMGADDNLAHIVEQPAPGYIVPPLLRDEIVFRKYELGYVDAVAEYASSSVFQLPAWQDTRAAIAAHVSDNYPARYTAREMSPARETSPARGMSPASPRQDANGAREDAGDIGDIGDFGDLRAQWQQLNALRPTKRLAGQEQTGLLESQKHIAMAGAGPVPAAPGPEVETRGRIVQIPSPNLGGARVESTPHRSSSTAAAR
jgi:hypothetical protein